MKQLIWIIFLFLCAIGLAMLAKTYTGNVYFVVEGYSLRMNLNFFIIAALLSVFVWYLLIKLIVGEHFRHAAPVKPVWRIAPQPQSCAGAQRRRLGIF